MILKLPIPPSVNAAYANNKRGRGRGRYKTAKYKAWLEAADGMLLEQKRGLVPVLAPAMVVIKLPMTMRGDISNRIKVVEDYLVSRELTADDSTHLHVGAVRDAAIEKGFCEIVVRAA